MNRRPVAESEIQRILALVPYLVAHPDSFKADVATRFGITRQQLDRDLELVLMVGVPPYTPGDYIDVDDDGEFVTLRMADSFRRPLRLTATEGLSVLAAGNTLLAVPGADQDGPLATALAKLAAALNFPDLDVVLQEPVHLQELRRAAERFEQIEIEYWTAGRNEITTRRIDPLAVFFAQGAWYVDAFCHRANDDRLFRVDRIRAVVPTVRTFNPDRERPLRNTAQALYAPRATDPIVTIEIDAADRWVADHYPIIEVFDVPDHNDRVRISMAVSEPVFLHRILIRLGPTARVVTATAPDDTDGMSTEVDIGSFRSSRVARAMLNQYRDRG